MYPYYFTALKDYTKKSLVEFIIIQEIIIIIYLFSYLYNYSSSADSSAPVITVLYRRRAYSHIIIILLRYMYNMYYNIL